MRLAAVSILVALSLIAAPVLAEESADSAKTSTLLETPSGSIAPQYDVTIERVKVTDGTLYDTLDVMIDSHGAPIGGFDLKIGTDGYLLEIMEVLKGEIPDSCQWEFFSARRLPERSRPGAPAVLWKATALAEFLSDSTTPPCFGFDRSASMIRLVVSSLHADLVPDTALPIFFYWQMCADNVVASAEGTAMLVSKQVFDYYPVSLESESDVFSTRQGTPQQCINPSKTNGPVRAVAFHNGGVEFELDLEPPADSTADSL